MQTVPGEAFLQRAADVGIGFDSRYPDSGSLSILPPCDHARFWVLPTDLATLPHFITSLLHGLDEWSSGCLWPRCGIWRADNDDERDALLPSLGIPDNLAGAVRFANDEEDAVITILNAFLAFGWCGTDDLYFIPDHGRQLMHTDHHDVIHVECASEERVMKLVARMTEAGYKLPTELPDATFRRPAWMPS